MKKRILLEAVALLLCLSVAASGCYVAGWLLQLPHRDYGCTWSRYLLEKQDDVDVMFFGSSLVYCDVAPGAIWEEAGIRSYVMAGPRQPMPLTYYYIQEALKTQSPSAIVLEVTGMFFQKYETFTQFNIDYMPWGWNRLRATMVAAEPELLPDLLFPLYSYHSRWRTATEEDVQWQMHPTLDPYCGYTPIMEATDSYDPLVAEELSIAYGDYANNLTYLQKIAALCQESDIRLMLYLSPSMDRIPEADRAVLEQDIAAIAPAAWLDGNALMEDLALEDPQYWFDRSHLNIYGAVRFSAFLGNYLLEEAVAAPAEGVDTTRWLQASQALQAKLEEG